MAKTQTKLIKLNFETCHSADLRRVFGLKNVEKHRDLADWLQAESAIPDKHSEALDHLRRQLALRKADWNEAELLNKFISPLLFLIPFSGKNFETFSERTLKAEINNYELSGKVDWVAAKGDYQPEAPYFFIHEYKQLNIPKADPLGQLLAAMLVARQQNGENIILYGCYVISHTWTFVVLSGNEYAESQSYDATDSTELAKIWSILQETKRRIEILANE